MKKFFLPICRSVYKKWRLIVLGLVTSVTFFLMSYMYHYALHSDTYMTYPCLSYIPSNTWRESLGLQVDDSKIETDLMTLKKYTNCIRVYQARGIYESIPKIAHKLGMTVRQGIWLDRDTGINEQEFIALNRIIKNTPKGTIESVVVGNEVLLFGRLDIETYISYFKRVKQMTETPIVWSDVYGVLLNTERMEAISPFVDIIGVHIFPYWQGISIDESVQNSINNFLLVKDRFLDTDKEIEVYEIGWPSEGYGNYNSDPNLENHIKYLQNVIPAFKAEEVTKVNVVEAFDQPSKMFMHNNEGWIGGHWGILDVWGIPKYFAHTIYIYWISCINILFFLWLRFLIPIKGGRLKSDINAYIFFVFSILLTMLIWSIGIFQLVSSYFIFMFAGMVLCILQTVTIIILLRIYCQIYFSQLQKNSICFPASYQPSSQYKQLKIAIHIPCAGENIARLDKVIQSCLIQTYPIEHIYVGINNCDFSQYKELLKKYENNNRVFVCDLGVCPGAKGEALNLLLQKTNQDIDYIAYLDSDYVVEKNWIEIATVSIIENQCQAVLFPQKYDSKTRIGMENDAVSIAAQLEFDLCFDIDSLYRSRVNAVLLHGTLCVVGRNILLQVGGWPKDNICEDSELGIKLLDKGGKIEFINMNIGEGIPPSSLQNYFKQHRRWAHGGMVSLRRMLSRYFISRKTKLTESQVRHYLFSWLPWILQIFLPSFFIAGFLGTIYLNYSPHLILPFGVVLFPVMMIMSNIVISVYFIRKKYFLSVRQILLGLLVFASTAPIICDGVISGLIGLKRPFQVTGKGINQKLRSGTRKISSTDEPRFSKVKAYVVYIQRNLSFYSLLVLSLTLFQIVYLIIFNRVDLLSMSVWFVFLFLVAFPSISEYILVTYYFKLSKVEKYQEVLQN